MEFERENKRLKVLIVILLIFLVAFGGYYFYEKIVITNKNDTKLKNNEEIVDEIDYKGYEETYQLSENETAISKYTFTKQNNYRSVIEPDEIHVTAIYPEAGTNILTLTNGKLYYYTSNDTDYVMSPNIDYKEYTELSGIKRIYGWNGMTTGVGFGTILITENGEVYSLDKESNNLENPFKLIKIDELSKYKVDKLLSINLTGGPGGLTYKVVLKDGTILEKTTQYIKNK